MLFAPCLRPQGGLLCHEPGADLHLPLSGKIDRWCACCRTVHGNVIKQAHLPATVNSLNPRAASAAASNALASKQYLQPGATSVNLQVVMLYLPDSSAARASGPGRDASCPDHAKQACPLSEEQAVALPPTHPPLGRFTSLLNSVSMSVVMLSPRALHCIARDVAYRYIYAWHAKIMCLTQMQPDLWMVHGHVVPVDVTCLALQRELAFPLAEEAASFWVAGSACRREACPVFDRSSISCRRHLLDLAKSLEVGLPFLGWHIDLLQVSRELCLRQGWGDACERSHDGLRAAVVKLT